MVDIANGTWSEPLWDLVQGGDGTKVGGVFYYCNKLTTFTSDLPSLTDGSGMFSRCENLTTFSVDLSSLTDGSDMFEYCETLSEFKSDLPNL